MARDGKVLATVTVGPGRMERLEAATYRHGQQPPNIELSFSPSEPGAMVCAPATIDRGNHLAIVYRCQNFGETTCVVTAHKLPS